MTMIHYRLYFMSFDGRHIEDFKPILGRNDLEAIEVAKTHICSSPLELWWRGRKVRDLPALSGRERESG
jgi:hypothetical protein